MFPAGTDHSIHAPAARPQFSPARLDLIERIVIGVLYIGLAYRLIASFAHGGDLGALVALAGETMVVVFVLIRKPAKEISAKPLDWALAFGATCGPLLVMPGGAPLAAAPIGVCLLMIGFCAQLWCKVNLFRSFGIAPARRDIVIKGPYAFVRHPIYASYFVSHVGLIYSFPTLWNVAILGVSAAVQVARIMAEERLLGQDAAYRDYMSKVRWRVIPGVF